jgi:hypothetical protein
MHHVLALELGRIHAKLARYHIHLAFIGEKSLGIPGGTHVPAGNLIGVNHPFFDQTVGNFIGTGASRGADQIARRLHRSISAAVKDEIKMMRDDGAVSLYAGLGFDNRGVTRIAGG